MRLARYELPGAASRLRTIAARLLLAALLAGLAIPCTAAGFPILVYHRFASRATDSMTVRTAAFEDQLARIRAAGFEVVPLRRFVDHLVRHAPAPPPRSLAITVDDGHRSVYTELLPLLRRYRIPVTLFIYPSAISNASYALTWPQLAELQATGLVDIQSHTYWHPNFHQEKRRLDAADYVRLVDSQLAKSKRVLEARSGGHVDLLAWPYGLYDDELEAHAASAGYVAAFTLDRRAARDGDNPLALPRYLMTDAVSEGSFSAILVQAAKPETAK